MSRIIGLFLKLTGLAVILAVAGLAVLLVSAGYWLPDSDEPAKADAIVLLGGDLSRPLYGADLYARGLAPVVYVSRPVSDPNLKRIRDLGVFLPREEDVSRDILLAKGVPARAIRYYGQGQLSTREEAANLAKIFGDRPVKLLVVTSPTHVRRARMILEQAMPKAGIAMCATPYDPFPRDWWNHTRSAKQMVLETAKAAFYLIGGAFFSEGAGANATEPGR